LFPKAKYIIIIQAEQADETDENWEGKMKLLKAKMERDAET